MTAKKVIYFITIMVYTNENDEFISDKATGFLNSFETTDWNYNIAKVDPKRLGKGFSPAYTKDVIPELE